MVDNSEQDKIKVECGRGSTITRWRGLTSALKPQTPNTYGAGTKTEKEKQPIDDDDGDLEHITDVDITLIQKRTYFLSAWIGDTNRSFNKYKGWIGLVIWLINIVIHFSLDFYEANFVFNISWATCIGLFFITLVVGCACMIKYSVPWFIKGVKKLKKDGHYPRTLRRLRLIMRVLPLAVPVFACGAAMGQFGCYWADGALKLSFGCKLVAGINSTCEPTVPPVVETMFNVFRATSLVHIFYGFALLLMFHMTLIFMIQSSMTEFNKRMAHMFRENPTDITFPEAVNLFSARSRFVREGSKSCMIVLTTLLVACSTSFVLNAYNFLFQKRFAIYIWFALAPLIWAVVPLLGAAWVTKTYHKYKLVVVNAWVDIPEEHELEAQAHEEVHKAHANDKDRAPSPSPARRMWSSMINRKDREKDRPASAGARSLGDRESDDDDTKKENARTLSADLAKRKWGSVVGRKGQNSNGDVSLISVKARSSFNSKDKPSNAQAEGEDIEKSENTKPVRDEVVTATKGAFSKLRKESEISLHFSSHPSNSNTEDKNSKQSTGVVQVQPHGSNPQIMLTDYDEKRKRTSSNITTVHETCSESSLVDIECDEKASQKRPNSFSSGHSTPTEENHSAESGKCVKIDMEAVDIPETKNDKSGSVAFKRPVEKSLSLPVSGVSNKHAPGDMSQSLEFIPDNVEKEVTEVVPSRNVRLQIPGNGKDSNDSQHKPNLMIGMAKTFHKWRTKTKKKRKFNFEKYITYLESILPTVGFAVGGVVITWDGVSFFTVLLLTMVGIFAQEAFFGS